MATKVEYSSDEGSDADQLANGRVGQRQSTRLKHCPGCKTSLGGRNHFFGPPSKDCEGPENQSQPSLVPDALKSEYELGPDPCGEEMLLMEKFRELEEQERRLRQVHLQRQIEAKQQAVACLEQANSMPLENSNSGLIVSGNQVPTAVSNSGPNSDDAGHQVDSTRWSTFNV